MSEVKWVRLSTDFYNNRKIKYVRRTTNGNDIALIWIMFIALAGRSNAGGLLCITKDLPYTVDMLVDELSFKKATINAAISIFESLEMIHRTEDGGIYITNWEKHQNEEKLSKIREQTKERVARSRAKKKTETDECNGDNSVTEALQDRYSNAIEKEEAEEDYSVIHSISREESKTECNAVTKPVENSARDRRESLGGELGGGVVMLSQEQWDDLLERLSLDEFNYYIGVVRDCIRNGKQFKRKTHYQAILDMAMADRKVKAK